MEVAGQILTAAVPVTGDWANQRTIEMGEIKLDKPGVPDVVLRAAQAQGWKAVNVWKLELAPAK